MKYCTYKDCDIVADTASKPKSLVDEKYMKDWCDESFGDPETVSDPVIWKTQNNDWRSKGKKFTGYKRGLV